MFKIGKIGKHFIAIILLLSAMVGVLTASAESASFSAYDGYEYDSYEVSHDAPVTYMPSKVCNYQSLGLDESFNSPSDIVYSNKKLYLLDSGNSRIVVIDEELQLIGLLDNFTDKDGNAVNFVGAKGMDIDSDGNFYIADTENCCILVFNSKLELLRTITRPDDALTDTTAPFDVTKIAVNRNDKLYAIAPSINLGIFTFDKQGEFLSFYGSNKVKVTAEVIKNYIMNKFLTKEQRSARAQVTPTVFNNLSIDEEGFVYTVKSSSLQSATSGIVKCLNYKGTDILSSDVLFGEFERDSVSSKVKRAGTSFIDIEVDQGGFINLLDAGRGRVYQYTFSGDLVGAFGGIGEQSGTFTEVAAIESVEDKIYVVDAQKNIIQEFSPTEYGDALRNAFMLDDSNDSDAKLAAWNKVLSLNSNSEYPYYGIGMVQDSLGDYENAMRNFEISNSKEEYSKAFQQFRKQFMADNTLLLILLAVIIVVAVVFLIKLIGKKLVAINGSAFSPLENKYTFPIYTSIHPVDGFDQFKTRKCEMYSLAIGILIAWFMAQTASFFFTGFIFNQNQASDYSLSVMLFSTIGVFMLFVIANWSVSTLLDGKGTFKEIFTSLAYSMLPYVVSIIINIGLSKILTLNESVFITIVTAIGIIWSALLVLMALSSIHQYSFSKTLGSVLLTFLGMLILAFIVILFYKLVQGVVSTLASLISEIRINL